MENQTQNRKKIFLKIFFICLIILIGLFLYLGGYQIFQESYKRWQESKQAYEAIKKYEQAFKEYNKVLEEDIYGGKTPQETLNMFISALEKGDVELASKYFALDENLSRKEWEEGLKKAKEEGRLEEIVSLLKKAQKSPSQPGYETAYEFVVLDENGMAIGTVFMRLNQHSGVWKIESMY
mgnify:CR=1 FL=1